MEPSTQYRRFAEECRHLDKSTKTVEERKVLRERRKGERFGRSLLPKRLTERVAKTGIRCSSPLDHHFDPYLSRLSVPEQTTLVPFAEKWLGFVHPLRLAPFSSTLRRSDSTRPICSWEAGPRYLANRQYSSDLLMGNSAVPGRITLGICMPSRPEEAILISPRLLRRKIRFL